MKENDSNKKCANCVHYLKHYIKSEIRYLPICYGHCTSKTPGGRFRKTDAPCECYEERDLLKEKEEQIKSATEWLAFIAERLNELTQILK